MSAEYRDISPVFCGHLDTAERMRNPWSYCVELVLTRLYFGPPALTDTMLLDTAALRGAYDNRETRNILETLFCQDNFVCLRRKTVGSFREVLGGMAQNRMLFSSLAERTQHGALNKVGESDDPDGAAEKFLRGLPLGERKVFDNYLKWLDELSCQIHEWPTIQPLVPRVKNAFAELDHSKLKKSASPQEMTYLEQFCADLEKPENLQKDRSWLWRKLGYHIKPGRPEPDETTVPDLCRKIVNDTYLYGLADNLGWSSAGRAKLDQRGVNLEAVRDWSYASFLPAWDKRYGTPGEADWRTNQSTRLLLSTLADVATEVTPLFARTRSGNNNVRAWSAFQNELRERCQNKLKRKIDLLEPPTWTDVPSERSTYGKAIGHSLGAFGTATGSAVLFFLGVNYDVSIQTLLSLGTTAALGSAYGNVAAVSRRSLEAPYMFCSRSLTTLATRWQLRKLIPVVWNDARKRRKREDRKTRTYK